MRELRLSRNLSPGRRSRRKKSRLQRPNCRCTCCPPQSNMREVRWSELTGWDNSQIPAFFRDSLVQVVARSYYLTRDNSDGSRSQAATLGGWIAYRSGLIADHFGIHGAL